MNGYFPKLTTQLMFYHDRLKTILLIQLTQHVAVLQLMEAPRDKVEKEGVKPNNDSATFHLHLHALLA